MLQDLLDTHPDVPGLWTDLAAAHVVHGQRADQPLALTRALRAAQRAVDLAPSMSEARFNRALASSLLGLGPDADLAWRDFLQVVDEGSPWAVEARNRRREIVEDGEPAGRWRSTRTAVITAAERNDAATVRTLISPYGAAARRWIETEVLHDWGVAWSTGHHQDAQRTLALARLIAAQLAALQGDPLLADAIAAIDRSSLEQRDHLATGHRLYAEAIRGAARLEADRLIDLHRRAGIAFRLGESPFSSWPVVGRAVALYQDHRLPEALDLLAGEQVVAERGRYTSLQARILWIQALCELYSNLLPQARGSYRAALERYRETGEVENQANVHVRLAEIYGLLQDDELAWRHYHQALRALPSMVHPGSRTYLLGSVAFALQTVGAPIAAQHLLEEALAVARTSEDDPRLLAFALYSFAESGTLLETREEALAVLGQALQVSRQIPEPMSTSMRAHIRAIEGRIFTEISPLRAAEAYTRALELFPVAEFRSLRARLLAQRAAARLDAASQAGGNRSAASRLRRQATDDLQASLREIDLEWQSVLDRRRRGENEDLWSSYFGRPQETISMVVGLLADQGRFEEAYRSAERSRARDLLDLVQERLGARSPLDLDEVMDALPSGTVLIQYTVVGDRLVTWAVRRTSYSASIDRPLLTKADPSPLVHHLRNPTRRGWDDHLLELLYPTLMPESVDLQPDEKIVFVPDGPLYQVPFSALRDPETGRYLIEDHAVATAPSATLYLHAVERNRSLSPVEPPSALFIGDPAFDPQRFPHLERLPEALTEARLAAAEYPGAILLFGEAATREAFLRLVGRRDVVHFAGHAVPLPAAPFKGMLVLAPSSEDSRGELYADELLHQELPSTRLVVLSACSTAWGVPPHSLGVAPLIRPFLGAGVPAVVGSLWNVDDSVTSDLLTGFHHYFRSGTEAAEALRLAQLGFIESENLLYAQPRSWAAFQVVGTSSLKAHPNTKE